MGSYSRQHELSVSTDGIKMFLNEQVTSYGHGCSHISELTLPNTDLEQYVIYKIFTAKM
jgi:hypothetical protein